MVNVNSYALALSEFMLLILLRTGLNLFKIAEVD